MRSKSKKDGLMMKLNEKKMCKKEHAYVTGQN